jgi:hypothetical protein
MNDNDDDTDGTCLAGSFGAAAASAWFVYISLLSFTLLLFDLSRCHDRL